MSDLPTIGIDVGATTTKIGLVGPVAAVLEHCAIPSDLRAADPSPFLSAAWAVVARYARRSAVQGIGISLCSLIDAAHTGALLSVNAPALNGLNIKRAFEERFGCPVRVLNDVNAHALAEARFGAGRGARRMLCLAAGTGIAIAALVDGRLIEMWGGVAADAARIILDPAAGVRCNGGVRGSAEALCSTAHIERLAAREYPSGSPGARAVIAASRAGDAAAGRVMAEIGGHIGHLLALLSPVFFPRAIVVAGGTAEAGEPLFRAIRQRYAALIGDYMAKLAALEAGAATPVGVDIVKGVLGPEAAMIGAAASLSAG